MPTLIAGVVAVVVLYLLLQMFRAANPAVLARAVRLSGGILSLAVAAYTGLRGELVVAIPLGLFGAGLLGWTPAQSMGFPNFRGLVAAGAEPRREREGASRPDEETASRPGGVDVPRRPSKRG